MKGIIVHRRPQVIKLSTLLDFYQAEPQSIYRLYIQNGYLKTDISKNASAYSSSNYRDSQPQKERGVDRVQKKTVGLFSNLIKNMDTNRQTVYEYNAEQQKMAKKQYKFYFREFQDQNEQIECKQMEITSIKKVKERATGFINVSLKKQQSKENKNEMNQKNAYVNNKQPSIDINFSFEEISNHLQQKKNLNQPKSQGEQINIKTITVDPPLKKQTSLQTKVQGQNNILPPSMFNDHDQSSKQLNIPQSLLPNIFSLQNKKQIFSPIPHKSRHQIRINNQPKIDPILHNNQNRSGVSVEGAKKAESRVYNNSQDSKDIKIDFDFQIDI